MEDRRKVISWALYDWANSAFAITVMSAFFPLFLKQYWSDGADATITTFRLGLANSIGGIVIALLSPILGERSAMTIPPIELARPSRKVVIVASAPSLQYCFRNSGKNADITVMANAELAQSYSAQEMTF